MKLLVEVDNVGYMQTIARIENMDRVSRVKVADVPEIEGFHLGVVVDTKMNLLPVVADAIRAVKGVKMVGELE